MRSGVEAATPRFRTLACALTCALAGAGQITLAQAASVGAGNAALERLEIVGTTPSGVGGLRKQQIAALLLGTPQGLSCIWSAYV
jgi:hypothetical protein